MTKFTADGDVGYLLGEDTPFGEGTDVFHLGGDWGDGIVANYDPTASGDTVFMDVEDLPVENFEEGDTTGRVQRYVSVGEWDQPDELHVPLPVRQVTYVCGWTTGPTIDGVEANVGFVMAIAEDGSSTTWVEDDYIYSIAADDTGVYVHVVDVIRKYSPDGVLLWEHALLGGDSDINHIDVRGTWLTFTVDGEYTSTIDTETGFLVMDEEDPAHYAERTRVGPNGQVWYLGQSTTLGLLGEGGFEVDWTVPSYIVGTFNKPSFLMTTDDDSVLYVWNLTSVYRVETSPLVITLIATVPADTTQVSVDPTTFEIFAAGDYWAMAYDADGVEKWGPIITQVWETGEGSGVGDKERHDEPWGHPMAKDGVFMVAGTWDELEEDHDHGSDHVFGPGRVLFSQEDGTVLLNDPPPTDATNGFTVSGGAVGKTTPVARISAIDADSTNYISLVSPTVINGVEGVTWKFRLSHAFEGRPMYAEKHNVEVHDYFIRNPLPGASYLPPDSVGWYPGEVTFAESLRMWAGVDGLWWYLTLLGHGRATFTFGDTSEEVRVQADRWYEAVMLFSKVDGVWTASVSIRDDTDEAIASGVTTIDAFGPSTVYLGAEGTVFGLEDVSVGFDEVSLVANVETFKIVGVEDAEVSSGWASETCIVAADGTFSIAASAAGGSANVYDPEGGLIDQDNWEETDESGVNYRLIDVEYSIVYVTYLVVAPTLDLSLRVGRPSQTYVDSNRLYWDGQSSPARG